MARSEKRFNLDTESHQIKEDTTKQTMVSSLTRAIDHWKIEKIHFRTIFYRNIIFSKNLNIPFIRVV